MLILEKKFSYNNNFIIVNIYILSMFFIKALFTMKKLTSNNVENNKMIIYLFLEF